VDLRDTHDSHLAMPPMAVPIAITFCKTMGLSMLRMMLGVYRSGYGSLTRLYTDQWAEFKIVEQGSQIVRFAITIVNYHNRHLIGRPNRIIVRRESHLRQIYSISSNKSMKADRQRATMDVPHTMAYEEGFYDCSGDVYL